MAVENLPTTAAAITELSAMLDAVADAIVVVDPDGIVRFANLGAIRLFGTHSEELLGRDFGHPVPISMVSEVEILAPSGVRVAEMRATGLTLHGTRYAVAVLTDVTERIRADRRLREAIRMREETLSIAAHELRTPLTVVNGMADTLSTRWDALDESERRHMAERIAVRASELQVLAERILSAKAGDRWGAAPTLEPVLPLLLRALEPFPRLDVEIVCSPDLVVWADGSHAVEIVTNLVSNAAKYGSEPVTIEARSLASAVEIRVSDAGAGVSPDLVPLLFDVGSREEASSALEGSGLGLAIVAKLATANLGQVWYQDNTDGGACFVVQLPSESGGEPADGDAESG